ncbi:MAG: hypothetical protein JXB88_15970 [Spirochaetales bacterium]|nr:hypothetical protein [Spirochaetales bacterium]
MRAKLEQENESRTQITIQTDVQPVHPPRMETGTTTPTLVTSTATPGPGTLGDCNEDGSIDIVDALLIAQYYVGFTTSFC